MGMGGGPRGGPDSFGQGWQYQSTIDPEELFRKIFGEAGFGRGTFDDFAESKFGFGRAEEVTFLWYIIQSINKALIENILSKLIRLVNIFYIIYDSFYSLFKLYLLEFSLYL